MLQLSSICIAAKLATAAVLTLHIQDIFATAPACCSALKQAAQQVSVAVNALRTMGACKEMSAVAWYGFNSYLESRCEFF